MYKEITKKIKEMKEMIEQANRIGNRAKKVGIENWLSNQNSFGIKLNLNFN